MELYEWWDGVINHNPGLNWGLLGLDVGVGKVECKKRTWVLERYLHGKLHMFAWGGEGRGGGGCMRFEHFRS